MEVPEHLRADITRIQSVIGYLRQQITQLEVQQAQLVFAGTGVNVMEGDWNLKPDWTLEQANVANPTPE